MKEVIPGNTSQVQVIMPVWRGNKSVQHYMLWSLVRADLSGRVHSEKATQTGHVHPLLTGEEACPSEICSLNKQVLHLLLDYAPFIWWSIASNFIRKLQLHICMPKNAMYSSNGEIQRICRFHFLPIPGLELKLADAGNDSFDSLWRQLAV
jgi:hypothetical protein